VKVEGYIVTESSRPMSLSWYDPENRPLILTHGGPVTLFPSYESARQACRRTIRYAQRFGYRWAHDYAIRQVSRDPA